jgi:transcriptional regulator with XRE-family HTH domain
MPGPVARTKLARIRLERAISQKALAEVTGLSIATYRRLERGEIKNPPLRYLVNCALALGVELDDVIDEEWKAWYVISRQAERPPARGWLSGRRS